MRFSLAVWLAIQPLLPEAGFRADDPALERFEFKEPHMGTEFRIVLYAAEGESARAAARDGFERIAELDRILSDYRPDSELMRLCAAAGGPAVRVSEELFTVLERAQDLSRRSGGAFDVTVGPAVRLWRRARRMHQMPSAERLARALERTGYRKVELDERARTVRLLESGMQLDLGGIAKGYAVDEALERLGRHGIVRALVAASGDIAVGAPPPGAPGWTVAVAPLDADDATPARVLWLRQQAVSTSGDTEQFVELDGKRYSHVLDPRTGLGLVDRATVTVVAPRGLAADGLATAVNVLGPVRGMALVESIPDAAALYVRRGPNGLEVFESKRFADIPEPQKDRASASQRLRGSAGGSVALKL